jgi:segregation and condensation protein B
MNRKPKAILEGILFASGDAVPVKRLSQVMELSEKEIEKLLSEMAEEYLANEERGIYIIRLEDSYQLCTKQQYYEYIHRLKEKARRAALTNAGLEVLSVVAYNQPVTRSTVEFIRGVNSDGPLNNLIASGLVQEMGRLDAPGRPILFGTTEEFLRCFNLSSLSELPEIDKEYSFDGLNGNMSTAPLSNGEEAINEDQIELEFEKEFEENEKPHQEEFLFDD